MRIGLYLARLEDTPPAESAVFTESERQYCLRRRFPAPHLAGRYAAKKAVTMALCFDENLAPDAIEVARRPGGAPTIVLHGEAANRARRAGVSKTHVSMSHSGSYAVALVVME